jgi:hypothetical protein
MILLAALLALQQAPEPDAAWKAANAACKKAREALANVRGVRAVSFGGVDGVYRLIVSVDAEDTRAGVREAVGFEYEGVRVNVYTPAVRQLVWAKPVEPEASAPSDKAPKEKFKAPADPSDKGKRRDEASISAAAAGELAEIEARSFVVGRETISVVELLQCDAVRAACGIPARPADRKEPRCDVVVRSTISGRTVTSTTLCRHREACPFGSETLLQRLPAPVTQSLARYAEVLQHPERAKKEKEALKK